LLPSEPLARARHRAMIEFGSAVLSDIWVLETARSREVFAARAAELERKFARLESEVRGLWFAGEKFGLVDAVFGPVFRYFDLFDRVLVHGILADKPKIAAWRAALAARPSVRDAVAADYPERLARFVARQNGHLAELMQRKAA
jgi:glutathione S-transferase